MDALLATALTVGVLGGVHCIAMCGGIVGAFTLKQIPVRVTAAPALVSVQVPFNAGRIASYGLAGFLAEIGRAHV